MGWFVGETGRRVTCDSKLGSLTTQGHLRLVGVTYDSKIGSLVPTGFWKGDMETGTLGLGVGLGDNPLGFGGWDMGTWGLGVGLGDNPLGFGGWDMGTWGLGVGLGDNPLGFGGWDMGTWGLGVGLGDNPLGFGGISPIFGVTGDPVLELQGTQLWSHKRPPARANPSFEETPPTSIYLPHFTYPSPTTPPLGLENT